MPSRREKLTTDSYYHVFNRSVEGITVFSSKSDYFRFISTICFCREFKGSYSFYFNGPCSNKSIYEVLGFRRMCNKNLKIDEKVKIIAYCIMSNHYHLLLSQSRDYGISDFMKSIQLGYSKYFNAKRQRFGTLWCGAFKSVPIKNEEQLFNVSRYIHRNPVVSSKTPTSFENLENYKYSSYREYLGLDAYGICDPDEIIKGNFSAKEYRKFVTI